MKKLEKNEEEVGDDEGEKEEIEVGEEGGE